MIVDDSAVIRGMLSRWLETDSGITIVNTSGNGVMALNAQAKIHA
jgi:chemotaxis response regulator CheB